jgi:hypothetical protein
MPTVVHPVVQHTNHQHSGIIYLEKDAMTAAGGHSEARPKVLTFAADCPSRREIFHGVAQSDQIALCALTAPGSQRIAPDRPQIRPNALGQVETSHRSAKKASI